MKESDWFFESVRRCAKLGFMKGTGRGFEPYGKVTRAQLCSIVYQIAGEPGPLIGENAPAEQPAEVQPAADEGPEAGAKWYDQALAWCRDSGVLGESRIASDPESEASREELAYALWRYHTLYEDANPETADDLNGHPDAGEISPYAEEALRWACGAGIMKGDEKGLLHPNDGLTRAELAALAERYAVLVEFPGTEMLK